MPNASLMSDHRYSSQIVYNNYPWPTAATEKQAAAVEDAAQMVLAVRDVEFKRDAATTLATLYDPDLMPPESVHYVDSMLIRWGYAGRVDWRLYSGLLI